MSWWRQNRCLHSYLPRRINQSESEKLLSFFSFYLVFFCVRLNVFPAKLNAGHYIRVSRRNSLEVVFPRESKSPGDVECGRAFVEYSLWDSWLAGGQGRQGRHPIPGQNITIEEYQKPKTYLNVWGVLGTEWYDYRRKIITRPEWHFRDGKC